jgi:hypothetical protein
MKFEDVVKLLKDGVNTAQSRRGYIVVSTEIGERKDVYDLSNIDSILLDLGTMKTKPDYIHSYSLYIENNTPFMFVTKFKKENNDNEYKCEMRKCI